jgi:phosphinothricin acetyltransferase
LIGHGRIVAYGGLLTTGCLRHDGNTSGMPEPLIRDATPADAEAIAAIHNAGIAERAATFQTEAQTAEDAINRMESGLGVVVAELDGSVVAWASAAPYERYPYYDGIAEVTVYVGPAVRRHGVGRALLEALATKAENAGRYKLFGKIFTTNEPSVALFKASGYAEVGIHRRHGRLDGEWRDVVIVELLLGDAAA